jgi:ubiquinone/menaquinone biosynthesis C-methylase UbiE
MLDTQGTARRRDSQNYGWARPEDATETQLKTRGLLVSGRAGIVDFLENMISFGRQEDILRATLKAAGIAPGHRLLDVGCGTGKLAIAASHIVGPMGDAIGVDATAEMIQRAKVRGVTEPSAARFQLAVAENLPFETGSMDAVTSSYFFHHLPGDVKPLALREMWRVLKPGGRLVITDYGRPRSLLGFIASFPMRFDFHEYVVGQLGGELERIIAAESYGEPELSDVFLGYIGVLKLIKT